jgi:two-component system sensor histidine kinase BaeS
MTPGTETSPARRRGIRSLGSERPARLAGRSAFQRLGLAPRLFFAMALVVVAGAGTLLLVSLLVAPQVFYAHLHRSGLPVVAPAVQHHVDEAFNQALLLSLALGVLAAIVAATLVTWLVSRRLASPVAEVAHATTRLADGHYDTVVPDPRLGPEFATLTAAVNQLAQRLGSSEEIRRRLLADLTHELRTPLASLEATVEAISDDILPVDQTTLDTLAEQASRLHRLVADLESVSRAEERQLALDPRPARLTDIAKRATDVMRPRFDNQAVTLTLNSPGQGPVVDLDADRLVEALMNLLDNALRHTPGGRAVTVTVDATPGTPFDPGRALLSVTDTGEGFEPAQAALLFERFYRTDPARSNSRTTGGSHGSGIGLTIARAIVEAHHGEITAHSSGRDHGARFTISLPIAAKRARD